MFEWLAKDPLNGIVITVAFFISVIIGRMLREKKTNHGKIIDIRIKVLSTFILIISITLLEHWYIPIIISVLCIFVSIKLNAFRDHIKSLIFPLVMGSFIFAVQSLTFGKNTINTEIFPVYVPVFAEGVASGFLIFSKVISSASILILLIISTSKDELLESMHWFGVPSTMLDISWFMNRYIKTFSSEGKKLKLAQESRCGFSRSSRYAEKVRDLAAISGLLIIHAFARSEKVYKAMLSRCWRPDSHFLAEERPVHKKDLIIGVVLFSGIMIMVGLDRLM